MEEKKAILLTLTYPTAWNADLEKRIKEKKYVSKQDYIRELIRRDLTQ